MKTRRIILTAVLALVAVGAFAPMASASGSSCYYSPRGCVSVSGYYKPSTGTYVKPYVRNYPGYGSSYSYRTPSYRTPSYSYRTPSYSYRTPSYSTSSYSYRTPSYSYGGY